MTINVVDCCWVSLHFSEDYLEEDVMLVFSHPYQMYIFVHIYTQELNLQIITHPTLIPVLHIQLLL